MKHKANSHGATVGKGGLADQMAPRKRADGSKAGGEAITGTSIFDPVLCELLVRWYSPPGGLILDPFAGGSVRGIVSAMLGRFYVGIELRPEQVIANWAQADDILVGNREGGTACWVQGDSYEVMSLPNALGDKIEAQATDAYPIENGFDFVMTCPPYADLEVYSDDPADISNMPYREFRQRFDVIMRAASRRLKDDRFLAVVIGDARDRKTGDYYGLPAHLISDMQAAGLALHNWHILATPAGTAPVRARNGFVKNRRACLVHQHVIVFVKGSAGAATKAIGEVQFGALDPLRFGEAEGGVADLAAALSQQ
jgi:DNA modification methylase